MKIIMISGHKRAGKDTSALLLKEIIESQNKTCKIISFASPIKQIISDTFNISLKMLDELKNNNEKIYIKESNYLKEISTFRSVLEYFGNEGMKSQFGDDVWFNLAVLKINQALSENIDFIIISDFRFQIEFDKMSKEFKTTTIRINDNNIINTDPHPSETELLDKKFTFDFYIDNTIKNINVLKESLKEIVNII